MPTRAEALGLMEQRVDDAAPRNCMKAVATASRFYAREQGA